MRTTQLRSLSAEGQLPIICRSLILAWQPSYPCKVCRHDPLGLRGPGRRRAGALRARVRSGGVAQVRGDARDGCGDGGVAGDLVDAAAIALLEGVDAKGHAARRAVARHQGVVRPFHARQRGGGAAVLRGASQAGYQLGQAGRVPVGHTLTRSLTSIGWTGTCGREEGADWQRPRGRVMLRDPRRR